MIYGREKLMKAVDILATGTAAPPQRLGDAFVSELIHITPERDLPKDLHEDYAKLEQALTSKDAVADEGKVAATVAEMTVEEAVEHINTVLDMYYTVMNP